MLTWIELLSEQQLSALLPPSLRYLLAHITQRHPRYLLRILNSFDEVYALIAILVERLYLQNYGGSFTENFYGLKRERVLHIKGGEIPRAQLSTPIIVRETLALQRDDVWKNLAVMVGVPYLKRKLDESYDIHAPQARLFGPTFNRDNLPPNATIKQRIMYYYKWFLRHIYPSINAAYYFSILAFNLAYLFDTSKYHSPFLWLIGTRIRRLGAADYQAFALAADAQPGVAPSPSGARPGESSSILHPRMLGQRLYPALLFSLKLFLPTSIFALKFLEWWHASDFARQLSKKATESLELPPPVIAGLKKAPKMSDLKEDSPERSSSHLPPNPPISSLSHLPIYVVDYPRGSTGLCPICVSPVQTPTACQTGYVFCYTCIYKWVDGSHERQAAFMGTGGGEEEGWAKEKESYEGKWESGKGRCAVSGRRVLGGTEGLRRIMA